MAKPQRIPLRLVGPSRDGRSLSLSAERSVNLFVEIIGEGKSAEAKLIGSPGLELLVDLGTGPTRGHHVFDGRLFAVSGRDVFEVFVDGTNRRWGEIPSSSGTVGMSDNNRKIVIGDGVGVFVLDLTAGTIIESLIEGVTPIASSVLGYLDGYTLAVIEDSGQVAYSELLDPATWLGTSYVTAEAQIDNAIGLLVLHEEVEILGETTVEPWRTADTGDNAFERVTGGIAEHGCGAPHAAFKFNDTFVFVGNTPIIWMMAGYQPRRISNHAVEYALGKVDLSTVTGFAFEEEGKQFAQINIGDTSWTFDATTGAFHERAWLNAATGKYERHRAEWCASVFGGNYVGDYENGKIYRQALGINSDDGAPMRRLRRFKIDNRSAADMTIDAFGITMEMGVGLDGDPLAFGADPKIWARFSFDGGATFGSWESESIGKIGEYSARAEFNRCGSGADPVVEVSISEPVDVILTGAWADVS